MPEQKLNPTFSIVVNNLDDYRGNIVQSFGLRLNNGNGVDARRGEIGCGSKMFPHTTTTDITGIGTIQSFIYTDADNSGRYWAADTNGLYKIGSLSSKFAADALANTPTNVNGDMVVFGKASSVDRLIVPKSTDLSMLNAGTWTASWWQTTLGQAALTSNLHPLLVFPNPFLLMIPDGNKIHTVDQANIVVNTRVQLPANHTIGWARYSNGNAYFGISTTDKSSAGVWEYDPVTEVATFYPYDLPGGTAGVPYVRKNQLFVVTSDGRIKRFDGSGFVLHKETVASRVNQNFVIHRNGIFVSDQFVYFLTSGLSGFYPAGVYVLDHIDENLYHINPLTTGTGDAGQYTLSSSGAIWGDGQFLLAGAAATGKGGIFCGTNFFAASVASRNWIMTPKIPAQSIAEVSWKLWHFFSLFSSESIVPKVRKVEFVNGYPDSLSAVTATWTSTTVFTVATSLSEIAEGDEVTILSGTKAGLTAHILSISQGGGTATVTLDEAIGLGSGTSEIQFLNFKKMTTISNGNLQFQGVSIPTAQQQGNWVQFKIEIRGTSSYLKGVSLDKQMYSRIL